MTINQKRKCDRQKKAGLVIIDFIKKQNFEDWKVKLKEKEYEKLSNN